MANGYAPSADQVRSVYAAGHARGLPDGPAWTAEYENGAAWFDRMIANVKAEAFERAAQIAEEWHEVYSANIAAAIRKEVTHG